MRSRYPEECSKCQKAPLRARQVHRKRLSREAATWASDHAGPSFSFSCFGGFRALFLSSGELSTQPHEGTRQFSPAIFQVTKPKHYDKVNKELSDDAVSDDCTASTTLSSRIDSRADSESD